MIWEDTSRAVGGWSFAYFLLLIVVSNWILLNLVVAVVLGSFAKQQHEEGEGATSSRSTPPLDKGMNGSPSRETSDEARCMDDCLPLSWQEDHSLGFMPIYHPLRVWATKLINWQLAADSAVSFDNAIVALILTSCASMTLDNCELVPGSASAIALERADHFFTGAFLLEMASKITVVLDHL